jgi:lipid A ethanolaminephosphotransferase
MGSLLFVAVLPGAWLLRQRIVWRPWWAQAWRNLAVSMLALGVLGGVTLASYQDLASLMRNHKHVRYLFNPLNVLYGGGKLAADAVPRARQTLQPIGLDARLGPTHASAQRAPLVVLVVGETARAANFSLGGYPRPTNPQLLSSCRPRAASPTSAMCAPAVPTPRPRCPACSRTWARRPTRPRTSA